MSDSVVGLISDTHGLLRPEAVDVLRGVDHLIHAGDVGKPDLLEPLSAIAPLTVVRGNVDHGAWAEALPDTAEVELGGRFIHVRHILEELDLEPSAAGFDVVVYGHSHKPDIEHRRGVLYVNPGSAGPRRFRLPVTVARLHLTEEAPRAELITLAVG
jgi:putative phosphoesterase